ncbi:MAG: FkbM family methyltransferase [Mucilaginibacter sp.]|nr:FkbM family methyltransferase [Mucilaginibacter sp.]
MTFFKKKIFKYIQSFGFISGIRLFFKIRRSRETELICFDIPGLQHPVFLRRNSSDFGVFEEVFIDKQYKTLIDKNASYIVDAGANIGLASLFFLKYYPHAIIICIEAEADNHSILLKNTIYYKNVICLHRALWNNLSNLKIKNLKADSWAFETEETMEENEAILAVTMNDILLTYDLPHIDILKIDIEGSEKEVFEANTLWIEKVKYLLVEIHEDMRKGAYLSVMTSMEKYCFKYNRCQSRYFFYK